MQLLLKPFFLLALGLYGANRFLLLWLKLDHYQIPYLNDLLCLPVVLTIALWLQRKLFPRTSRFRLNAAQVIFAVFYFSLFFEGMLPAISDRYTRDYWDVLAYAAGGIIYYFILNPRPDSPSNVA
jgi:hypothetical protein